MLIKGFHYFYLDLGSDVFLWHSAWDSSTRQEMNMFSTPKCLRQRKTKLDLTGQGNNLIFFERCRVMESMEMHLLLCWLGEYLEQSVIPFDDNEDIVKQEYGQCQSLCPLPQKGNIVNSSTSECGKVDCQVLLKLLFLEEQKMFSFSLSCLYLSLLYYTAKGSIWSLELFISCVQRETLSNIFIVPFCSHRFG